MLDLVLALCLGVGLAAACGLRVFLPMAVASVASKAGFIELGSGFEWISSWPAVAGLSLACVLEVVAYYVPWLDHALDSIATPAAVVAGALVSASQVLPALSGGEPGSADAVREMHPLIKAIVPMLVGGATAGLVQLGTVAARSVSTITTGGLGNPVVATAENVSSLALAVLAILVPLAAGLLLVAAFVLVVRWRVARARRRAMPRAIAA